MIIGIFTNGEKLRATNPIIRHYEINIHCWIGKLCMYTVHVHSFWHIRRVRRNLWQYYSIHESSPWTGLIYFVIPASYCFRYLFLFSWQLLWTDCMNLSQGSHGVFTSINMPDKGLWILTALHVLIELLFTNILKNIYFSVSQKKGSHWHFIYRLWGIMGYLSSTPTQMSFSQTGNYLLWNTKIDLFK